MANSDKNIVITPNINQTAQPKIVFTGADAQDITLSVLDSAGLSISGASGQLFSVIDNLTGTIFSVNDISGVPSLEIDDDGTIRLAEFAGNVLIGTATDTGSDLLQVDGSVFTAGSINIGDGSVDSRLVIKRVDGTAADDIQFYNGTTRVGEIGTSDTTWLRINQDTAKNIYTPRYIRADGGFFVDGTTYGISGTGVMQSATGATIGGNTAWHTGNDGSGSGLDADTVDGLQASSFLRGDTSDTFTTLSGTAITIGSGVELRESTDRADLLQITSSTSSWGGLQIRNSSNEGRWSFMTNGSAAGIYDDENNDWHIYMTENAGVQLRYNGSTKVQTTSTGATVTGDINSTSDARVKDNVEVIENALQKIKQIRGVTFTRLDQEDKEKRHAGVIAQEVEKVLPEVVTQTGEYKTVAYGNLTALLIEAIKQQQIQIDNQQRLIEELQEKFK